MRSTVIHLRLQTIVAMIIVILLSVSVVGCSNAEKSAENSKESPNRYFIFTSGKIGFIDEKGTIVIKPSFDDIEGSFSEGLCAVKSGDKWGYIDCSGAFIINPQYDEANMFSEGVALIKKDDKYGYIDNTGKEIINPQYDNAGSFTEGLARVLVGGKYGFIDKSGKMIINPEYDYARNFSECLAAVRFGERVGFIDTKGQYIINPQYYYANNFSEGLACFMQNYTAEHGYIDKTGKVVINAQFIDAGSFSEGMATVKIGDKWGYVDKTGKILINPTYDDANEFSEGLACVKIGQKWGFIDKEGKYVVNPQYDNVASFKNGMALTIKYNVSKDPVTITMSYIDATGNSIWSLDLEESDIPQNNNQESSDVTSSEDTGSIISPWEADWTITASSRLKPEESLSYEPDLIMDYDTSTAWVEGKANDGIGEWVKFKLPDNEKVRINKIEITNGYQKSEELYYANNRVRKIQIDFSDGTSVIEELADNNFGDVDTIYLPQEKLTSYVKITILDVYAGSKYKDTCISEVNFL